MFIAFFLSLQGWFSGISRSVDEQIFCDFMHALFFQGAVILLCLSLFSCLFFDLSPNVLPPPSCNNWTPTSNDKALNAKRRDFAASICFSLEAEAEFLSFSSAF